MRPIRPFVTGLLTVALLAGAGALSSASGAPGTTVTGTVRLVVVDPAAPGAGDPVDGDLRTRAVADAGGRLVDLPETGAGLRDGDVVAMTTPTVGSSTATEVRLLRRATESPRAWSVAPSVLGTHTLTVLPVYWSSPDEAAPTATLEALAQAAADYWAQQSGGRITVAPQVREWTRIPDPRSCSSSALANAALAAHHVDLPDSDADHVLVYFPHRDDCGGWAGLGQVSGSLIWDNGYPLLDVFAHEFGHNLGLGHANAATCTSGGNRVILSGTCSVQEYRDYADVMGIAADAPTGSLNTALADSLGLARTVTASPGTRTVTDLAPLARTEDVRAVRIRLTSGWLYLDYRPAIGRDQRVPAWAGVQAHVLPDADVPATRLLDGQPGLARPLTAVALPPGTAWAVPGTSLTVTVLSVTPSGARVEVAPTATATVPAAPVITSPAGRAVVGSTTTVGWRLNSVASSVRVIVDGQEVTTVPATGWTGAARVTGLAEGVHSLTLRAVDTAGQASAPSTPVAVTADLTPPSMPAGLGLSTSQVLTWRRSTDPVAGVGGYLVSLDGGTPARLGSATSFAARTPAGRHTWWVAAVDRVGNASPAAGLVVQRTAGGAARAVQKVTARAGDGQRALVTGRTVGGSSAR